MEREKAASPTETSYGLLIGCVRTTARNRQVRSASQPGGTVSSRERGRLSQ